MARHATRLREMQTWSVVGISGDLQLALDVSPDVRSLREASCGC